MLKKLNDWVTQALLIIAAVLAFLLCFLVVADVIGRVIFNSPVKGTPEIVSSSIVVICFLQAGYAIRSGGMLNVDAFVSKLPPGIQGWIGALGALLGALFFAFLCWASLDGAAHAWNSNEFEGEGALARASLACALRDRAGYCSGGNQLHSADARETLPWRVPARHPPLRQPNTDRSRHVQRRRHDHLGNCAAGTGILRPCILPSRSASPA